MAHVLLNLQAMDFKTKETDRADDWEVEVDIGHYRVVF